MVPDGEKEEIKRVFPSLMFSLPIQLHKQAGAILLIISKSDFPQNWQGLLPVPPISSSCCRQNLCSSPPSRSL